MFYVCTLSHYTHPWVALSTILQGVRMLQKHRCDHISAHANVNLLKEAFVPCVGHAHRTYEYNGILEQD